MFWEELRTTNLAAAFVIRHSLVRQMRTKHYNIQSSGNRAGARSFTFTRIHPERMDGSKMAKVRLTAEGKARLTAELDNLIHVRRQEITERIRQAREEAHGDSGDSTAYEEAKTELALIEQRISELENTLSEVEVVEEHAGAWTEVALGAHVIVRDDQGVEDEYIIVDHAEADPRHGRISQISPVGSALLSRKVGDQVAVKTPDGARELTIVRIE